MPERHALGRATREVDPLDCTEQISRIREDGFVHIRGVFGGELMQQLRDDICAEAVGKEDGSQDRTLTDGYPRLASFRAVIDSPVLQDLAREVCGPNAFLQFAKGATRARLEGELPMHVDTGPKNELAVDHPGSFMSVHVLCEPIATEDGPTYFVAGSHRLLRTFTSDEALTAPRSWVEGATGDVLAWHGEIWHGRLIRTTPGSRVSLIARFVSAGLLDEPSRVE